MSEKRKPCYTIIAKKSGQRSNKIEIYNASDFEPKKYIAGKNSDNCFRLRVNGRWFPKGERKFYWKTEIMQLLSKSIQF